MTNHMHRHYQPDWDIYTCAIEDSPAIIGLDLDLRRFAPLKDKPHALFISVYLNHPRSDGFPQSEEFATLGEIEDSLVEHLEDKLNAFFVGRTISNGVRDFYFYTGNTLLHDKAIADVMINFPSYRYDFGVQEDRTWELYFDFLLPDVQEFQRIQNRKVLRTLQKHADNSECPRPVDHWIFFTRETERDQYWQQVKEQGFRIEKNNRSSEKDYPYALHISRMDKTTDDSIDQVVMYLWELARVLNGRYDGWETNIVK
ncbi:MAG TPA: DUF695 domain-containing protein [Chitinophaga sp.]|uniref:DUF695 domain-containing protein n=1 Tax=Chitinophaga sp. TaxID=1869181 RepID=UPI002DBE829B|nr:DUF695 domain-containing protein [Chitinophaga sp.]HEU4554344.1 DUF695 domain-containing protein [Chitinophaga sp.]